LSLRSDDDVKLLAKSNFFEITAKNAFRVAVNQPIKIVGFYNIKEDPIDFYDEIASLKDWNEDLFLYFHLNPDRV